MKMNESIAEAEDSQFVVSYKDTTGQYTVLIKAGDADEADMKLERELGPMARRINRAVPYRGHEKIDQILTVYKDPQYPVRNRTMLVDKEKSSSPIPTPPLPTNQNSGNLTNRMTSGGGMGSQRLDRNLNPMKLPNT